MKLTQEQIAIINSTGNIKINAVAGSGKTFTLIEYAKAKPKNSKILYLAFNKSIKQEAAEKFKNAGLTNVEIHTAHSLAHKHIVQGNGYKVVVSYKTYEIKEILNLRLVGGDPHGDYILASHINRLFGCFCNSSLESIDEIDYTSILTEEKAIIFARNFSGLIYRGAKELFLKMENRDISVSHEFYLKKFQLSKPTLVYDYILFDEGQDASAVMLDIFLKQNSVKVIVGDSHQQIYSWRYAVNSLDKVDFSDYNLTRSFRFNEEIGFLAMKVLRWKSKFMKYEPINVWGSATPGKVITRAFLARTNITLLHAAIDLVCKEKVVNKIYFEGNLNSYTYARDGASLNDVIYLFKGENSKIKDRILRQMESFDDLKSFIDKTGDIELSMLYSVVDEYREETNALLDILKGKHLEGDKRDEAELIFSTVHKCKGMEYDEVTLLDDFIDETKLDNTLNEVSTENINMNALNEEINLIYVAITRAKSVLNIRESQLPSFESIVVSDYNEDEEEMDYEVAEALDELADYDEFNIENRSLESAGKNINSLNNYMSRLSEIKKKYPNAYERWSQEDDAKLELMYCEGYKMKQLTDCFGRRPGAIRSRIEKLELEIKYPGLR